MENLRKRTARDVHDARAYSVANFARDMLSVSDNLKRALEAIPAEVLASGDAGFKTLADGVEMTERAMMSAMERHGVKKWTPGPEIRSEFPSGDVRNSKCRRAAQHGAAGCAGGFVIGDRMLRPALVGVSKGGPKQASAEGQPRAWPDQSPGGKRRLIRSSDQLS